MGNMIFIKKNFKKTSEDMRRATEKSIQKLISKIEQYESSGTPFEKIFNDDSVKYDVLGNNFFTMKAQSTQMPLRILYKFNRDENHGFTIEVHHTHIKKHNNKEYMREFATYASSH